MEEQIVSIEVAKLAKEKGFNEKCRYYYTLPSRTLHDNTEDIEIWYNGEIDEKFNYDSNKYSAPTQALLQKWFREKHSIDITVITNYSTYKEGELQLDKTYRVGVIYIQNNLIETFFIRPKKEKFKFVEFETYEQALKEGLYQALKLIKNE